jgi:organic radical activating enzyme
LIAALHDEGFKIAVETNGTIMPLPDIDWLCVSPKAAAELLLRSGQELKLIFPQLGAELEKYDQLDFQRFFLQPMDNSDREANRQRTLDYVLAHPQWRISLRLHKILRVR